ncbi:MAG: proliferating cell nuclear antigen (pcna) [Methanomassiliicoccaceae archaeon]|jgi:proliferating cell nuclear antigen|nr:proliferating cell nuclear antigen (pcna) [Methanomassiliicoccaceae archaeon]
MFKAEIKSDTLKGLVSVISTLVDEAKFSISEEGVNLKAVDPAHVAMVDLTIGKGAFESFSAGNGTEIGVDLDKMKDMLKLAGPNDIIMMEKDEVQGRLVIKVGNITRRMNLVDTAGMNDPKVPQLSLPVNVEVAISELQRGMKAAESVSDHIALSADADAFELFCEGDTDSVSLKLPKEKLASISASSKVRSLFPLDYFSNLVKAIPSDTVVKISLGNDYPVKISFTFANGNGNVGYLLAPRIEND